MMEYVMLNGWHGRNLDQKPAKWKDLGWSEEHRAWWQWEKKPDKLCLFRHLFEFNLRWILTWIPGFGSIWTAGLCWTTRFSGSSHFQSVLRAFLPKLCQRLA
jgi:hypothetical protein